MKRILMPALCGIVFARVPALAAPQTYTDDYISFEYDDESDCKIIRITGKDFVSYTMYPNGDNGDAYNVSVKYEINQEFIDSFMDPKVDGILTYEPVEGSDNKRIVTMTYEGKTSGSIQELVSVDGDKSIALSTTDNLGDGSAFADMCNTFLASLKFYDFDSIPELTEEQQKYGVVETIYEKKHYSDQTIKYAKKALATCQKYLDMEITGEEAADVFSEIERRTKGNEGDDIDIYWAVFTKDYRFKHGTDSDIAEIMEDLQAIVDSQQ